MLLGAQVQYGQNVPLWGGGKFIGLFVEMYTAAIGWFVYFSIVLAAFACIYGTTIVAVDGYSRSNLQAWAGRLKAAGAACGCGVGLCADSVFQQCNRQNDTVCDDGPVSFRPRFAWLNLGLARIRRQARMAAAAGVAGFGLFGGDGGGLPVEGVGA